MRSFLLCFFKVKCKLWEGFQIGTLGIMWMNHTIINWACQCSFLPWELFLQIYKEKWRNWEVICKEKKKKKKLEVPFCEIWFSFGNSLNKGSCYNVCNLIFLLTVLTPLWLLQRPDCFFFLLRGLLNLWYYNAFMDQIQQMCIGHW